MRYLTFLFICFLASSIFCFIYQPDQTQLSPSQINTPTKTRIPTITYGIPPTPTDYIPPTPDPRWTPTPTRPPIPTMHVLPTYTPAPPTPVGPWPDTPPKTIRFAGRTVYLLPVRPLYYQAHTTYQDQRLIQPGAQLSSTFIGIQYEFTAHPQAFHIAATNQLTQTQVYTTAPSGPLVDLEFTAIRDKIWMRINSGESISSPNNHMVQMIDSDQIFYGDNTFQWFDAIRSAQLVNKNVSKNGFITDRYHIELNNLDKTNKKASTGKFARFEADIWVATTGSHIVAAQSDVVMKPPYDVLVKLHATYDLTNINRAFQINEPLPGPPPSALHGLGQQFPAYPEAHLERSGDDFLMYKISGGPEYLDKAVKYYRKILPTKGWKEQQYIAKSTGTWLLFKNQQHTLGISIYYTQPEIDIFVVIDPQTPFP